MKAFILGLIAIACFILASLFAGPTHQAFRGICATGFLLTVNLLVMGGMFRKRS